MWQRYNQTSHIFEKSIDNGVIWTPLPLSGAVITEGTIPNVAYRNAANVFLFPQRIDAANPQIILNDTSQPATTKAFDIIDTVQTLKFRALGDNLSTVIITPLSLDRGGGVTIGGELTLPSTGRIKWGTTAATAAIRGNTASIEVVTGDNTAYATARAMNFVSTGTGSNLLDLTTGAIYLAGRSVALGSWTAWTPTITNASGTLLSVGNIVCRYMIIGKTFYYAVYVDTVNITVATVNVRVSYPAGITASSPGNFWTGNRIYMPTVGYGSGIIRPAASWLELTRFDDTNIPIGVTHFYSGIGFFDIP